MKKHLKLVLICAAVVLIFAGIFGSVALAADNTTAPATNAPGAQVCQGQCGNGTCDGTCAGQCTGENCKSNCQGAGQGNCAGNCAGAQGNCAGQGNCAKISGSASGGCAGGCGMMNRAK